MIKLEEKDVICMNGKNYFNETSFNEMCEELEKGSTISISIDCIGHTRTFYETAHYVEELIMKYGDTFEVLETDVTNYWCTVYRLKR